MYLTHFGLSQQPFKITAHSAFFYPGGNRGPILDALIYAIRQGEGIVKVSGEVGSGKTMLCRMLQERLPVEVETVYVANPSVSPEEILHAIAFEMRLSLSRSGSRLDVMQAIQSHLLGRHSQGKRVVILVEEAQSMPLATLEEIRLLSNLETRHDKLLQIVLFGQPELDRNLALPGMRQLRERITHGFVLRPLSVAETGDYLSYRLRAAGYHGPDLFGPGVVKRIARASQGLTRRVNIIADKVLLAAFAAHTHTLTVDHVRAAVADGDRRLPSVSRGWRQMAAGTALLAMGAVAGILLHAFLRAPEAPNRLPKPPQNKGVVLKAALAAETDPASLRAKPIAQSAVPGLPGDIVAQRMAAADKWLATQDQATTSIQLMGSNDLDQLREHLTRIGRLLEMDQIFVCRTKVNGQPAWTVLYGVFASRSEAAAALGAIPESLKRDRPYLRTVQGVKAEIGQYRFE